MQSTRVLLSATLVALILLAGPTRAGAQDFDDIAAYVALNFTPLGGLVPQPPLATGAGRSAFVLRYGNLDAGGDDAGSLHNFSIGADFATARGRLGLTLGGSTCDGCDGNIMAGVDYTLALTQNVVSVALRPAAGFSKLLGDSEGTALSLGLSLPIGVEFSGATGPVFIPYIVPGFGFGRISGDGDSESGTRPMLGGGFAIVGRQAPYGLHAGFQRVFIEDGEMAFGLGVSIGRRSP